MKGHPSYLEDGGEWRPDGEEAGSLLSSEAQPSLSHIICRQRSAPDVRLLVTFVHFTKDFELPSAGDFCSFHKRFRITF